MESRFQRQTLPSPPPLTKLSAALLCPIVAVGCQVVVGLFVARANRVGLGADLQDQEGGACQVEQRREIVVDELVVMPGNLHSSFQERT